MSRYIMDYNSSNKIKEFKEKGSDGSDWGFFLFYSQVELE